jgi:hypothetical protein
VEFACQLRCTAFSPCVETTNRKTKLQEIEQSDVGGLFERGCGRDGGVGNPALVGTPILEFSSSAHWDTLQTEPRHQSPTCNKHPATCKALPTLGSWQKSALPPELSQLSQYPQPSSLPPTIRRVFILTTTTTAQITLQILLANPRHFVLGFLCLRPRFDPATTAHPYPTASASLRERVSPTNPPRSQPAPTALVRRCTHGTPKLFRPVLRQPIKGLVPQEPNCRSVSSLQEKV